MKTKKETALKCILYLLPILFIWQGLDFTDMGFSLSNALFFDQPGVIQDQGLAYFFSNFIGWLWLKISAPFGIIGARFGWCVLMWGVFYFSNKILMQLMPEWRSLIFIIFTFLFVVMTPWINYNDLSSLFTLISLYFIIQASKSSLSKNKVLFLLFLSGICSGLNVFIRLPNVITLSFALIPVVVTLLCDASMPSKKIVTQCVCFISGWLASICVVLFFMKVTGYIEYYLDTLILLREMAVDPNGHHGLKLLITLLKDNHIDVCKYTIKFFVAICGMLLVIAMIPWKIIRYIVAVGIALCFIRFVVIEQPYYKYICVIAGMCYVVLAAQLINMYKKRDCKVKATIYTSILGMFICVPLGSNNGIKNIIFSLWLSLPLILERMYGLSAVTNKKIFHRLSNQYMHYLTNALTLGGKLLIIVPFVYISIYHAWTYTYRDSRSRFSMVYPIQHEKLEYVYTTKERANVVQELLHEMDKYVGKYEYLLAFDVASTLHYVYTWKPYLYSTWEFLFEPQLFANILKRAEKEHTLPLVVKTKETLITLDWPRRNNPYVLNSNRYYGDRTIVEYFIKKHGYSMQWENDTFEIWGICAR